VVLLATAASRAAAGSSACSLTRSSTTLRTVVHCWLLAERGDLEELGRRADAGDQAAAFALAGLLAERGDLEELGRRAC
jgi:hypothetical protein